MSSTFAIGLGDRSVSQVIDLLKTLDVEFLVDVRSQADSDQHALFSPEPLQELPGCDTCLWVTRSAQNPVIRACSVTGFCHLDVCDAS